MAEQQTEQQPELSPEPSVVDQLLMVLSLWLKRLDALQALVIAETRLNIRALAVFTGLIMVTVLVVIGLWLSVLACIGMVAYWLIKSLLPAVVIVIVFQWLVLWWLLVSMGRVRGKLGYQRTIDAFGTITRPAPDEMNATQEQSNGG